MVERDRSVFMVNRQDYQLAFIRGKFAVDWKQKKKKLAVEQKSFFGEKNPPSCKIPEITQSVSWTSNPSSGGYNGYCQKLGSMPRGTLMQSFPAALGNNQDTESPSRGTSRCPCLLSQSSQMPPLPPILSCFRLCACG